MAKSALPEQVRQTCKLKHFSLKTEKAYLTWIKRFIIFNNRRHPKEIGEEEISLSKIDHIHRPRRSSKLPVVFTKEEVNAVIDQLHGTKGRGQIYRSQTPSVY